MSPIQSEAKIMVLGDSPSGLGSFVVALLQRGQGPARVVVLSKDPGPVVTSLLQREGHQLQICNPREALEISLSIRPDLVVLEPEVLTGLIAELSAAQERLRSLSGLIAICSHCKKVRKSDGQWEAIETYLGRNFPCEFTHTLCPAHRQIPLVS
jgi:hypothetical protein